MLQVLFIAGILLTSALPQPPQPDIPSSSQEAEEQDDLEFGTMKPDDGLYCPPDRNLLDPDYWDC